MTSRVSDIQLQKAFLSQINSNRAQFNKHSEEVASGVLVDSAGDSRIAGAISMFKDSYQKLEGHESRIKQLEGVLNYQDRALADATEGLVRAQEIASQGANEVIGGEQRALLAEEVWGLRDHLVSLGNSTYEGKYIFAGAVDNLPPFNPDATPYTVPTTGNASTRYTYTTAAGAQTVRSVPIGDAINIQVNTPGDDLFSLGISALERLGRALSGYSSTVNATTGLTDGGGVQLTFPTDFTQQTSEIRAALDGVKTVRETSILPTRSSLGGRLKRLDVAENIIDFTKAGLEEQLSTFRDADLADSATKLTLAQTALQASFAVTTRVLGQTILDYI